MDSAWIGTYINPDVIHIIMNTEIEKGEPAPQAGRKGEREKIRQDAIEVLWNGGWAEEDIAIAISKPLKYVKYVRDLGFLGTRDLVEKRIE